MRKVETSELRVLPANGDLTAAEVNLLGVDNAPQRLRDALAVVWEHFDVVLIDCPPSLCSPSTPDGGKP
ncbi:MAG: AAA family ATPase [Candidatus Competibacteraceae bacterium]